MNPESASSLIIVLQLVKEYWFLITLALSIVATVIYMIVFGVNPWDAHKDASTRRQLVRFHNQAGFKFLEQGRYAMAQDEFDRALKLRPMNYEALAGHYLTGLFLSKEDQEWDAAVGDAIKDQIVLLSRSKDSRSAHIVEKYLADLHYRIADTINARKHYERALSIKRDYPDALLSFAWFLYFDGSKTDYPLMEELFRDLTESYAYDYRGFHGLGYALYMQGIIETDVTRRKELIAAATVPADQARALKFNHINTVGDLGEITRTTNPHWSLFYHEIGLKLLDDPETANLSDNLAPLGAQLLLHDGEVTMKTPDDKRAWLTYQLALDYLAVHRRNEQSREDPLTAHARFLEDATKLDPQSTIRPIYDDQLAILDLLLPDPAAPD